MDLTREELEKGCICAGCGQYAKIYTRKLNASMAASLIKFARYYLFNRIDKSKFFHEDSILSHPENTDFAKLRFWNLIESRRDFKLDGNSAGFWRITNLGYDFVAGNIEVPSKIKIYNNEKYGRSEALTTIQKSLGKKFNYRELMNDWIQ